MADTFSDEWGDAEEAPPPKRTPPKDEGVIPAFEASLGIALPRGSAAAVSKRALDKLNNEKRQEREDMLKYHQEVATVASMFSKRAIRPDEIAALRRRMFDIVGTSLEQVDQVLQGKVQWNATQTRLFAILTERVMPKLSTITVDDPSAKRKLEDLTIEELETIALGKRKAGAVDAVMAKAEVLDDAAEKRERFEAKKEVTRQLAYIDALDTAEKQYVAAQIAGKVEAAEHGEAPAKHQPKFTPEQIENVRAARRVPLEEHWRRQGLTEEQIAEKRQARVDKIVATKAELKAERLARLAVTEGLGSDEQEMARTLRRTRDATMRSFRVPSAKGVRKQSALTKQAAERAEKAERQKQRDEAPRVYLDKLEGIPEELRGSLTLADLRELRPDLFRPSASGLGASEEEVDRIVAERQAAEKAAKESGE